MEYCHEQEQISEQYFQFWSKCVNAIVKINQV